MGQASSAVLDLARMAEEAHDRAQSCQSSTPQCSLIAGGDHMDSFMASGILSITLSGKKMLRMLRRLQDGRWQIIVRMPSRRCSHSGVEYLKNEIAEEVEQNTSIQLTYVYLCLSSRACNYRPR